MTTPTVERYFSLIYELGFVSSKVRARSRLEHIFRGIEFKDKRMLDVGGGRGLYSYYAASMGAREVICLEPEGKGSTTGVARDFERIRSELPGAPVVFDTRTVQEYPPGETFDIIFMHASINHLDENACIHLLDDAGAWERYKRTLTHLGNLAKSGAELVVIDCSRRNFFAWLGMKNPLCPEVEWAKHHEPEVWARLFEEVGFRDPKVSWEPLYPLGKPAKLLSGNRIAAFFTKSVFRLEMEKA